MKKKKHKVKIGSIVYLGSAQSGKGITRIERLLFAHPPEVII